MFEIRTHAVVTGRMYSRRTTSSRIQCNTKLDSLSLSLSPSCSYFNVRSLATRWAINVFSISHPRLLCFRCLFACCISFSCPFAYTHTHTSSYSWRILERKPRKGEKEREKSTFLSGFLLVLSIFGYLQLFRGMRKGRRVIDLDRPWKLWPWEERRVFDRRRERWIPGAAL